MKKGVMYVLVFGWIIFSAIYIVKDQIYEFQNTQLKNAYDKGLIDAGKAVITQSEECKPFSIGVDEKSVELISTKCLSNLSQQNNSNEQSLEKK